MRRSVLTALLLCLGLVLWMASGQLGSANRTTGPGEQPAAARAREPAPFRVGVRHSTAEPAVIEITANGRTEAARKVELKAEVRGRVVEVPVPRGAAVEAGEVVVRLDQRDRAANLQMAEAMLQQRQIEHDAAQKLRAKGFQAETEAAAAAARLEEARAAVETMRIDVANSAIRAPFAGVLDWRTVEIGDYLDVGDPVATILELDPLLVVGHLPETRAGDVRRGMAGAARTIAGQRLAGRVRYVAMEAHDETRTLRLELETPNPGRAVAAGVSATIALPLDPVPAHKVSSSALVLDDAGELGVHIVDAADRVGFHPARIVRAEAEAVWLAGLPPEVWVITVGQAFVRPGDRVTPVPEGSTLPTAAGPESRAAPPAERRG